MLISVRVVNHPTGERYRAGLHFDKTAHEHDVTAEQYEAIAADPYLEAVVLEADAEVAEQLEAPDAPEVPEPAEDAPEAPDAEVAEQLEAPDAPEVPEPAEDAPEAPDAEVAAVLPAFDDLTIKQLRAYAAEKGIDLGKATRKADIIALL